MVYFLPAFIWEDKKCITAKGRMLDKFFLWSVKDSCLHAVLSMKWLKKGEFSPTSCVGSCLPPNQTPGLSNSVVTRVLDTSPLGFRQGSTGNWRSQRLHMEFPVCTLCASPSHIALWQTLQISIIAKSKWSYNILWHHFCTSLMGSQCYSSHPW